MYLERTFVLYIENQELKQLYENHKTYHEGDSGLDLFVPEDFEMPPRSTARINLKIKVQTMDRKKNVMRYHSCYMVPRSSMCGTGLRLANSIGVIDAGYTGELIAQLDNITNNSIKVKKGDRLLQLINSNGKPARFDVSQTNNIRETSRGENKIGSTNKLKHHVNLVRKSSNFKKKVQEKNLNRVAEEPKQDINKVYKSVTSVKI